MFYPISWLIPFLGVYAREKYPKILNKNRTETQCSDYGWSLGFLGCSRKQALLDMDMQKSAKKILCKMKTIIRVSASSQGLSRAAEHPPTHKRMDRGYWSPGTLAVSKLGNLTNRRVNTRCYYEWEHICPQFSDYSTISNIAQRLKPLKVIIRADSGISIPINVKSDFKKISYITILKCTFSCI